jgi:hypothetical protein
VMPSLLPENFSDFSIIAFVLIVVYDHNSPNLNDISHRPALLFCATKRILKV